MVAQAFDVPEAELEQRAVMGSQKETAEAMAQVKDGMKQRGDLDTQAKRTATDEIGGAITHLR